PQRAALGLTGALPFTGSDVWTAYELTWLDPRGKPAIAIATMEVPASSPAIVESKSMKLYLGSFAQSSFASADAVIAAIEHDVSIKTGAKVRVALNDATRFADERVAELDGDTLDTLPVDCSVYEIHPA